MDFLFTQLMLHYKAQGVQRFALGMAPMAGMVTHELAPRWHRFGRWLFDSGESFYNFRGLRSFKDKFHPGLGAALSCRAARRGDLAVGRGCHRR